MRIPDIYKADELKNHPEQFCDGRGKWFLSRPYGLCGLGIITRIKMAWLVFTGKCDILDWEK